MEKRYAKVLTTGYAFRKSYNPGNGIMKFYSSNASVASGGSITWENIFNIYPDGRIGANQFCNVNGGNYVDLAIRCTQGQVLVTKADGNWACGNVASVTLDTTQDCEVYFESFINGRVAKKYSVIRGKPNDKIGVTISYNYDNENAIIYTEVIDAYSWSRGLFKGSEFVKDGYLSVVSYLSNKSRINSLTGAYVSGELLLKPGANIRIQGRPTEALIARVNRGSHAKPLFF